MTIHEAAEDAVRAWEEIPEPIRRRLGQGFGTRDYALDLNVRMRLLAGAVERVHSMRPGRILEYPNPRPGHGEQQFSGPMTEIPLAEIVVRSDGGPWAVHNQPCAVCGARAAILDLSQGVMLPCGQCVALGWETRRVGIGVLRFWWEQLAGVVRGQPERVARAQQKRRGR